MRLAPASQDQLEQFFCQRFGDERLLLPRLNLHAGLFAECLTKTFSVSAITFGSHVLIAPRLLKRDDDGKLRAPGRLIAHEAMHVLQYKRLGYVHFLSRYLREYAVALKKAGGQARARHGAAYRAISFEIEARAAEEAFAHWAQETATRSAPVLTTLERRRKT